MLTGNSVSGDIARGRVCNLSSHEDGRPCAEGEILVAASTHPELLPFLRGIKAIVSDEGGILSHAAILARELNIPCIVGTGIATRTFHDGEIVYVDAIKGVVRKI